MEELELSVMGRVPNNEQVLQPILDSFKARTGQTVRAQMHDWGTGRSDLIKTALYHHGPDVSEVGTTWVSDLVGMNALRPFSAAEVAQFGPPNTFLPAAWKTTQIAGDPEVWSIPWLTESYVLHYRKDIMRANGIDEASAFSTPARLLDTAQTLRKAGYPLPIAVPPQNAGAMILHVASSWVWRAGGELLSPDGRQVVFTSPEALEGFQTYYRLLGALAPEGLQTLNALGITRCFLEGHAPLAISGPWLNPRVARHELIPDKDWGITRLPGPPFVGGSNLVIWKHTHQDRYCLELIRQLASLTESTHYGDDTGIFSAHVRGLSASRYQEDLFLHTMSESIQAGKSFPTLPLWGLVEDRLINAMGNIWEAFARGEQAGMADTIEKTLNRVARSLNLTLSQR
jgi:multiple sugar transport system substrate-binding protein